MVEQVKNFIKYVQENNLSVEAICLSTRDEVLIKHSFVPWKKRVIYSHTKSFTSTLVGISIDEGKLSLETRLVDVFKEEISKEKYDLLYPIKVKHLLTMSSGFDTPLLFRYQRDYDQGYPDFFKFMFDQTLKVEPGSKFLYSNGDSHLLALILQHIYQKPFIQIAYDKLFKLLHIPFPIWGTDPSGVAFGASDLMLDCEEMNRLGRLYLNNGIFDGVRVVSEDWVKKCSIPQINPVTYIDWFTNGYSYQFWCGPYEGNYRADGAYGQFTFVFPEKGYVLSIQKYEDDKIEEVKNALREIVFKPIFEK